MPFATSGIDLPYQSVNAGVIPGSVFWLGINFYADRCPLLSHLDKGPLGALSFIMNNDNYRPRSSFTAAAYTSTGATLTVTDSSLFTVGDVIQVDSERFLVTNINNANTIAVTYAFEGTTQANHVNNSVITLVTNARTGGDVDQNAINRIPTVVTQYSQTVQHAVQVAGNQQSATNYMGGAVTPLQRARMLALQHTMDDFESAMYYGKGQGVNASVNNQVMKGFQTLLTTNSTTSPTNASSYKPSDLVRDTVQKCYTAGGNPDTLIVAPSFLVGLETWGFNLQLIPPKSTELGVRIQELYVPFLNGIRIIPAPLLASGQAICFNSAEVKVRVKRQLDYIPRGIRGDATEGDVIMEGALDVENEYHHAWLSGVTGFAVQS